MNDSSAIKPLGRCFWNGNEIVCESHPELGGIAGIGANVPEEWAHIFAAAPDLLKALIDVLACLESYIPESDSEFIHLRRARSAIAKAKGEVP